MAPNVRWPSRSNLRWEYQLRQRDGYWSLSNGVNDVDPGGSATYIQLQVRDHHPWKLNMEPAKIELNGLRTYFRGVKAEGLFCPFIVFATEVFRVSWQEQVLCEGNNNSKAGTCFTAGNSNIFHHQTRGKTSSLQTAFWILRDKLVSVVHKQWYSDLVIPKNKHLS